MNYDDNSKDSIDEILDGVNNANQLQKAINGGSLLSGMLEGLAMSSPHAIILMEILKHRKEISQLVIFFIMLISLPVFIIVSLPSIVFEDSSLHIHENYNKIDTMLREVLTEAYTIRIDEVNNLIIAVTNGEEDDESNIKYEIKESSFFFDTALIISQYCVFRDTEFDSIGVNDLKALIIPHKENLFTYSSESNIEKQFNDDGEEVEITKITYMVNYVGDDYFATNIFFLNEEERMYANQMAQNLMLFLNGGFYDGAIGTSNVSESVSKHRDLFLKYATLYGVPEYVELIMAVAMQESSGNRIDIMQSAEGKFNTRYPKVRDGIKDLEYSIECGVQELKEALSLAGCTSPSDINRLSLALQGYNFGPGYISWALKNYGGYSEANAIEFSDMMVAKPGWKYNIYGDKKYVEHVLRYYNPYVGGGDWGSPFVGRDWQKAVSSEFGSRIDPITGKQGAYHNGLDIAYPSGTPINAVKAGRVTKATDSGGGYGNQIILDHGDGTTSMYAHCSVLYVKYGETVSKGQVIAGVGTTGRSTGNHLHLTMTVNGQEVNPRNYVSY